MGKSGKNLPFIVVFIGIISFVFLSQIFSTDFRIKILNIFRTPLTLISGAYYALKDVSGFKELQNENKILKEEIANIKKAMVKMREINLQNQRLTKLIGFIEPKKTKLVPAMVIARDILGFKDTIIIDKGKKDKVRKNMVVISGSGLVGRVRECGWSISRVLLITDRDSVVSGIVERTRDEGAVEGNMRKGLVMKYLRLGCDIKKGDKVITSGFGGIFEKGILIGEIVSVEEDDSTLYMNAMMKPEVDLTKLEEVLVIR